MVSYAALMFLVSVASPDGDSDLRVDRSSRIDRLVKAKRLVNWRRHRPKTEYMLGVEDHVRPNFSAFVWNLSRSKSIRIEHTIGDKWIAFTTPFESIVLKLAEHPSVEVVYPDTPTTFESVQVLSSAPEFWGLDYIDETRNGTGSYQRNRRYSYSDRGDGDGVTVYVVDSGVQDQHGQFGSRLLPGYIAVGANQNVEFSHGTNVASIIASQSVGVAKRAKIYPVKVDISNVESRSRVICDGLAHILNSATGRRREHVVTAGSIGLGERSDVPLRGGLLPAIDECGLRGGSQRGKQR